MFSVGQVLLFKLLEASQCVIVGGEEIEGLTAKAFRGDFDLVRTSCSFPVNRLGAMLIQEVHF